MASLILLIVLAVYCIWSLRHMAKRRKEKHGKCAGLSLSGDWNVPIKAAFCPSRRTLFPNGRIWVQSVDEDGFPAYDEDTVK